MTAVAFSKSAERAKKVKSALDRVRRDCDIRARRDADPVGIVHSFSDPLAQELVALLAASLAFGNAKTIRAKLSEALDRMGPSLLSAAEDLQALRVALAGWVHRVFRGEDIARLLYGARQIQRVHGSLGQKFASDLGAAMSLRGALAQFCTAIRVAGGLPLQQTKSARRGPMHILANPLGPSSCKRLLLFLRWMIRPVDGVDLGLWPVSPSVLVIPLDTHIHKLSQNLGLTRRRDASWRTAVEITDALSLFDAKDPVKYDFSLCHLGMLQRCPSRRDSKRCQGCPVKPICRHW